MELLNNKIFTNCNNFEARCGIWGGMVPRISRI